MNSPTPKFAKWMTMAASVIVMAACNSSDTTAPDTSLDAAFDQTDPVAVTFNSTFGLPDGPFADAASMPFLTGLTLPNGVTIQRPIAFGALASAGAQLPDSLKLTTIQKVQIAALVTAFEAANKARHRRDDSRARASESGTQVGCIEGLGVGNSECREASGVARRGECGSAARINSSRVDPGAKGVD